MARDILIVGGGVIGLCTAYYCARRGDRVTLLDRNLEERDGLLVLCHSQHTLEEESNTAQQALQLGLPAQVFDARQTASMDPGVRMDVAGSVYFPMDCHLAPQRFIAGLQRQLNALGARFLWNTRVVDWRVSNRRIVAVVTNQGDFSADEYVLCGGAWSPEIAASLGLSLPMQAGKEYSLTLTRPRQMPRFCAILSEARVAVTPIGSSLRFAGTMEMAGMNEEINPVRVQGIMKAVVKYYPDFGPGDFAGIQPWCGLRPCSPDGLPYLGRFKNYDNLSTATGDSMMGVSLGPVTGRLMAQLLAHDEPEIDVGLMAPDRFA